MLDRAFGPLLSWPRRSTNRESLNDAEPVTAGEVRELRSESSGLSSTSSNVTNTILPRASLRGRICQADGAV